MAEKLVMTKSDEATAAIFGAFDYNIRMIERAFDVRISNRNRNSTDGDAISVYGDEHSVDMTDRPFCADLGPFKNHFANVDFLFYTALFHDKYVLSENVSALFDQSTANFFVAIHNTYILSSRQSVYP